MRLAFIAVCTAMLSNAAFAALPQKPAAVKPARILDGSGAATGGVAGTSFSLTNVTLAKTPGKERVVLDIGDIAGAPVKGLPGYYHVELQENPRRVVIDLAQTPNVFIDEKQIKARLKESKLISNATVLIDPADQTLSLILDLRKKSKAQVFQVPGKKGTGRVVVDLQ